MSPKCHNTQTRMTVLLSNSYLLNNRSEKTSRDIGIIQYSSQKFQTALPNLFIFSFSREVKI